LQQNSHYTTKFPIPADADHNLDMKGTLKQVYAALQEKGYSPVSQIVGYIISEDPTYITNHKGARGMIRRIDRDELLQVLLRKYLEIED